jgi:UDP-N-acetylmuramate-alanine ligase
MFQKDTVAIRVLAGTNMYFNTVGAILEMATTDARKSEFVAAYATELRKVLDALGWDDVAIHQNEYSRGLIFAIPTEFDYTYAGCKILSVTFDLVAASFNEQPELDFAAEIDYLDYVLSKERYMTLRNIYNEAQARSLNVYFYDDIITIGSGKGAFSANIDEIGFADVPWEQIYEIPSVMVTGTNGKTTTVRLTSFISQHAGKVVGYCSTDWVMIGEQIVSQGDLSGPNGNRTVMTNPAVDVAVLEVARGGIVKRGLATSHVNAAVVMNVSEDHLGMNGIDSVHDLARAKFTVQNAVRPGGHHVINLDDSESHQFIAKLSEGRAFISQKLSEAEIKQFMQHPEDYACFVENGAFVVLKDSHKTVIAMVNQVELTYNGVAKHNIENVLAAICLSLELGRSYAEITSGLLAFESAIHNHGRFNLFEVDGAKLLIDYGHNVASVDSILKFARSIATANSRITVLLGFSGDRKFLIDSIAKSVVKYDVDHVILKMFTSHLRGAEVGELANLLQERLIKRGYPQHNILATVETEMEALNLVLARMQPEGIYILFCQDEAAEVIAAIKNFATKQ